jgi:hypothetical protein
MTEFKSLDAAEKRLQNSTPLSDEEARALFPWVLHPAHQYLPRVQMDLALQQISAINRFNEASGKLTKGAIFVAIAQVIVAIVAVLIALRH